MTPSDRDILERAVAAISEQATKASGVIDEAMDAGIPADHPVTIAAKMLRLELLKTKAELERGLEQFQTHLYRLRPERALGGRPRQRGGALVARRTGAPRRACWSRGSIPSLPEALAGEDRAK